MRNITCDKCGEGICSGEFFDDLVKFCSPTVTLEGNHPDGKRVVRRYTIESIDEKPGDFCNICIIRAFIEAGITDRDIEKFKDKQDVKEPVKTFEDAIQTLQRVLRDNK